MLRRTLQRLSSLGRGWGVGVPRFSARRVAVSVTFGHLYPLSPLRAYPPPDHTWTWFNLREAFGRLLFNINVQNSLTSSTSLRDRVTRVLSLFLKADSYHDSE